MSIEVNKEITSNETRSRRTDLNSRLWAAFAIIWVAVPVGFNLAEGSEILDGSVIIPIMMQFMIVANASGKQKNQLCVVFCMFWAVLSFLHVVMRLMN